MEQKNKEHFIATDDWINALLSSISMQWHRRLSRRCSVSPDDIKQDLWLLAFENVNWLDDIRRCASENMARQLIYAFFDPKRNKKLRYYLKNWPSINHIQS